MHKPARFTLRRPFRLVATFLIGIVITVALAMLLGAAIPAEAQDDLDLYLPVIAKEVPPAAVADYVLLGWNDLGMHCYNRDFQDLGVLPPYNTLWAQVIKRGNPPVIMTDTVTVTFRFPDNTYSVGKSNFWTYAKQLFGVDLAPDMGLAGFGLSGDMEAKADHFVAEGIPLTEFSDSNPTLRDPYQLAELVALDAGGKVLAQNTVVAPVSTEMRCDNCHNDGGVEDIRTGRVETNILDAARRGKCRRVSRRHTGRLMDRRPSALRRVPRLQCTRRAGRGRPAQPVQGHAREARRQGAADDGRLLQLPPRPDDQVPARCHVLTAWHGLRRLSRQHGESGGKLEPLAQRAALR